ncbi:MAG: transglutaminase domain-containing protein [Mucilaginibacter sp.]
MKKNALALLLFLSSVNLFAQDFQVAVPTAEEISMKKYAKDTSAHALYLNEYGRGKIDVTNGDNIRLFFNYHAKIKIFDTKGLDKGTVEIPIYNSTDEQYFDEVEDIKGFTVYTDDNGNAQQVNLDPKTVHKVKLNKNHSALRFAMPGLKSGCIIEYSYTIVSPFWDSFHTWEFQDDAPKVHSEFEAHIPAFWHFNALIRGALKLNKSIAEAEPDCFSTHGAKSGCAHLVYGMNDIPAFIEEDHMTASKNFLSAIYFELSDYTNPYDGSKKILSKEWKDVDYDLKHADYFGSQIKKTNLMKPHILPVIAGKTNDLEKAKAVYEYVQKNMKWNNYYGRGSYDGISKAFDNHTGSVADINLMLVAALNAAGINAEAVLLSTRDNGLVNKLYPTVEDFDYVIAKVNIGDKSYFLDATDPLLAFGMLPLRCINGEGRVMSLDKPSYWLDIKPQQKRSDTYSLDLTLQNDGKIKGTMTHFSIGYEAYEKRKAIKKFNSIDEYVDHLADGLTKIKILKSEVSNLDSLNTPVSEVYQIEMNSYKDMGASERLLFNPIIVDRTTTNPFKLAERTYPVDWGMPSDSRFVVTMHIPENYTIESAPKPMALALPNQGGSFVTSYDGSDNTFTYSFVTRFGKSVYGTEEYPYLKEIFNKIILAEKSELVFKKK